MKVTVCELGDDLADAEWSQLAEHVTAMGSELVLLPEMPFYPWIAATARFEANKWEEAVEAHEARIARLAELGAAVVLGSRPAATHRNEGFIWQAGLGYKRVHDKYYLPEESGFWEATWYRRGDSEFTVADAGVARIGFAICTEIWFTEHARAYARQGVQLLACPRATERSTIDKWVAGGTAAAIMAGAFCLSSNRGGTGSGVQWGGCGWIIDPDGRLLGTTSVEDPFLSIEIDLSQADQAKTSYPRYVEE